MKETSRELLLLLTFLLWQVSTADHYDVRCKCVCPNVGIINLNTTSPSTEERRVYIRNVAPRSDSASKTRRDSVCCSHCDCQNVVIPSLEDKHVERLPEAFCPRCVCRYEQRNTLIIKVVVREGGQK